MQQTLYAFFLNYSTIFATTEYMSVRNLPSGSVFDTDGLFLTFADRLRLHSCQNSCSSKKLLIWFSIIYEGCLSCGKIPHPMSGGLLFGRTALLLSVDRDLTILAGELECFKYACSQSIWVMWSLYTRKWCSRQMFSWSSSKFVAMTWDEMSLKGVEDHRPSRFWRVYPLFTNFSLRIFWLYKDI